MEHSHWHNAGKSEEELKNRRNGLSDGLTDLGVIEDFGLIEHHREEMKEGEIGFVQTSDGPSSTLQPHLPPPFATL